MVRTAGLIVGLRTENPITTVRRVLSVIERVVANVCFYNVDSGQHVWKAARERANSEAGDTMDLAMFRRYMNPQV